MVGALMDHPLIPRCPINTSCIQVRIPLREMRRESKMKITMNHRTKWFTLMGVLVMGVLLASCKPSDEGKKGPTIVENPESIVLPSPESVAAPRERYDNKFGEDLIPGQWEGYGIGDPQILRYNGMYYLYVSTKDAETGIRAWKSEDLIHWEQATGAGLRTGYVSEDPITRGAYAPEVFYWNGTFYMYTSPLGNGHYVLTADSPEGPFINQT